MNFLPTKLARRRHVDLDARLRRSLHETLQAVHRAIYAGRGDVAAALARLAASICRPPSSDDDGRFSQTTHVTKGTR